MDRDIARQTLADIDRTRERALALKNYAQLGPVFAAWGVAWLVMNLSNHFHVPFGGLLGACAIVSATTISIVFGKAGRPKSDAPAAGNKAALASAMIGIAIFGVVALIAPTDLLSANAVVSWIAASAYALAGLWLGARISILGIVLAVVVVGAWFLAREWFELLMGVVGGGVLLTTGLWLWRA